MKLYLLFAAFNLLVCLQGYSQPVWAISNLDSTNNVLWGGFDYTDADIGSEFYQPDTNILGHHQLAGNPSLVFVPSIPTISSDTVLVFFHGGGFRAGDADSSWAEAINITAETGYITVLVEYPRGISHTDPQYEEDTVFTSWFCTVDRDSVNAAIDLAMLYSRQALNFIAGMQLRYNGKGGASVQFIPAISSDDRPIPGMERMSSALFRPRSLILMGTSAGGAIVYHQVLFNDSKRKWNVIGAISLWGSFGQDRLDENSGIIPYHDVPILAVHNPCDGKSPYNKGVPFGVVPQLNYPPNYMDTICCDNTYPEGVGSKWLVDHYREKYAEGQSHRMLLVSSCDRVRGYSGHGSGFFARDNTSVKESRLKALETFLWWNKQKDLLASQNAWHLMLYSHSPTALFEWDGPCDICPSCD